MNIAVSRSDWHAGLKGADIPPLPPGTVLRGRFELIEMIGRGSVSTVYRAIDDRRRLARSPDLEVALKVVAAGGDLSAEISEALHREARYLHELAHPNIVRAFDADCDGVYHFVVLELLRGRSLTKILASRSDRRLPIDLVIRIVGAAAAGLGHAHRRGIVHGDIKPNNIFVTFDGEVKVLDFGAARLMRPSPEEAGNLDAARDIGALTPLYASLETIAGDTPAESDDVFSLAVLAYVMITGAHPFGGKTAAEALRTGIRPERPPPLSGPRWRALRKALALEHRHRLETMDELVASFARRPWLERLFG